jgi:hypothetical protein
MQINICRKISSLFSEIWSYVFCGCLCTTTGWDCNLCISISPTIVWKREYAGDAHM